MAIDLGDGHAVVDFAQAATASPCSRTARKLTGILDAAEMLTDQAVLRARGTGCPGCTDYGFDPASLQLLYQQNMSIRRHH